MYDEKYFKDICQQFTFVIMGFLKDFLTSESERLIKWIDTYSKDKKITTYYGTNKYPYHPILWIKINKGKPFEDVVKALEKII